ncbi:hypothetical protein ACFPRL_22960 [Pseudoclavibacter helvolus]
MPGLAVAVRTCPGATWAWPQLALTPLAHPRPPLLAWTREAVPRPVRRP